MDEEDDMCVAFDESDLYRYVFAKAGDQLDGFVSYQQMARFRNRLVREVTSHAKENPDEYAYVYIEPANELERDSGRMFLFREHGGVRAYGSIDVRTARDIESQYDNTVRKSMRASIKAL